MMRIAFVALVVCLAVLTKHSVDGCRCIPDKLPTPRYCRTPYLGLVKVTRAAMDKNNQRQRYYYEVIKDFTDFGKTHRSLLEFNSIDDPMAKTSCQTHLEVNQIYLIGAQMDEGSHQPVFTPCTTWIESWNLTGAQSDAKIAEMQKHCGHKPN